MGIIKEKFGTEKGKDVYLYTMSNSKGMTVKAMNLGCHIMEINAPDRDGNIEDVVLSFDDLEAAKKQTAFFGVVAGRCANRIKGATFELNGRTYKLFANNGENHLHGGKEGFDKKVWDSEILEDGDGVRFYYLSPDGEEGYPGNLKAQVTYSLTEDNELKIEYEAVSDADTIINLTNHSYFNLAGHDSGTILDHYLKMNCDEYTECDSDRIPTGVIAKVEGTPFDFREYHRIGERIDAPNEQLKNGRGYDHNFVINNEDGKVVHAASLWDKKSGRIMEVY
ncbi:MAG: galactose mutarotase, partial [Clostridiales bacterium]|nr:galactose mutarotase [Clostridiales bacterium]